MLCSRCKIDQPRAEFGPNADMWPTRRECKACRRQVSSVKKHGIGAAEKAEIAASQGGCRICGHDDPGSKGWVVDHDHECCPGEASCPKCRRGVLCAYCNHLLGSAFDFPRILRAAAEYLERPRDCSWHIPVACAPSICGRSAPLYATNGTDSNGQTQMVLSSDESSPNASHAETATTRLASVESLLAHARKVSPSPAMTVYVGDLERALGRRADAVRGIVGANDSGASA